MWELPVYLLTMSLNIQINRFSEQLLTENDQRILVLLTGARQTGKTTLIKKKYSDLPYYNLDAFEYREQLSSISTFNWGKEVGEAVFDEIQKEAQLLNKIKYSFDERTINFSVLLGSAQILLLSKIKETLAGRIMIYELFPFLLSELVAGDNPLIKPLLSQIIKTQNIDDLLNKMSSVVLGSEWDEILKKEDYLIQWGGMPSLVHIDNDELKQRWLKSYSIAYLERDLSDLANLQDLKPFRKFQQIAALRTANLLSFSSIAADAGISAETARRYVEYLRISYQVFLLSPYGTNLTSSVIKTPKIYWIDNGLFREISGKGFNTSDGVDFENYVASELMKYLRTMGSNARLTFYRTRSGMEIDFILETDNGIVAFEVKNRDQVTPMDFSAMRKVGEAAKEKWLGGLVIYRGNKIIQWEEKLWAVPSCRLFSNI